MKDKIPVAVSFEFGFRQRLRMAWELLVYRPIDLRFSVPAFLSKGRILTGVHIPGRRVSK